MLEEENEKANDYQREALSHPWRCHYLHFKKMFDPAVFNQGFECKIFIWGFHKHNI